jgi:hypothetical protein
MDRHDRPRRQSRHDRKIPTIEALEGRLLPSFFGWYSTSYNQAYYQAQVVQHDYDQYVSELKRIELASQATPAEYLALRNDARAISLAANGSGLPRANVQLQAVATSLELDRAPLYGSLGDAGWAGESSQLTADLGGLDVPQPLIAQTIADMRTLAVSANVGPYDFATFTNDFTILRDAEQTLPSGSGYHFEDPSLFYTQHLRGFFRGWSMQKVEARTTLDRDLAAIRHQAGTPPAGAIVLNRDLQILESIDAVLPSTTMAAFNATYAAALTPGSLTPAESSQLRSNLIAIAGTAATPGRTASIDQLVSDVPRFAAAVGSSTTAIETLITDVETLVDAGGGETLNPFKVTIQPG